MEQYAPESSKTLLKLTLLLPLNHTYTVWSTLDLIIYSSLRFSVPTYPGCSKTKPLPACTGWAAGDGLLMTIIHFVCIIYCESPLQRFLWHQWVVHHLHLHLPPWRLTNAAPGKYYILSMKPTELAKMHSRVKIMFIPSFDQYIETVVLKQHLFFSWLILSQAFHQDKMLAAEKPR